MFLSLSLAFLFSPSFNMNISIDNTCISPLKTVGRCSCCSWTFPKTQRAPFLRAMLRALLCVYACGTRVRVWKKDLISTDLYNVHQKYSYFLYYITLSKWACAWKPKCLYVYCWSGSLFADCCFFSSVMLCGYVSHVYIYLIDYFLTVFFIHFAWN